MKSLRQFSSLLLLSFVCLNSPAQLSLPVRVPNNLRPAVEKVLSTYSDHYSPIKGDTVSVSKTSIVYASKVKPESAENCTLTEYLNTDKYDYSWEAVLYNSEEFETAAKKYNTTCQQLKNMTMRTGGESCKMEGEYEAPGETKNFYSTVFTPSTVNPALDRVRVEVLLQSDLTSWTLRVLVYDRVHEDREGNLN
jgi:hypothetical protein